MRSSNEKLFLCCLKATELIEKKFIIGLSLREHIQLFLHKSICNVCKNYEKQSALLDQKLNRHFNSIKKEISKSEVDNLKERIRTSLKE